MANRLRRRTSDQTVLGSNPAVAAALSPWTRLFTPIVPRRSLHTSFYSLSGHPCKINTGKKKKEMQERRHWIVNKIVWEVLGQLPLGNSRFFCDRHYLDFFLTSCTALLSWPSKSNQTAASEQTNSIFTKCIFVTSVPPGRTFIDIFADRAVAGEACWTLAAIWSRSVFTLGIRMTVMIAEEAFIYVIALIPIPCVAIETLTVIWSNSVNAVSALITWIQLGDALIHIGAASSISIETDRALALIRTKAIGTGTVTMAASGSFTFVDVLIKQS